MTDNENILIERLFQEAARQQIEDNGFTERVMDSLPAGSTSHRLSRLWTWFCIVLGVVLFWLFNGWETLMASGRMLLSSMVTALEVFLTTVPTTDLHLDPVLLLLVLAFVGVYLPYQTYRKLSTTL